MSTPDKRLKLLRVGLSQQAMATSLGIPQTTWSNYENDKNKPHFALINIICSEFEVNVDWLLFGRGSAQVDITKNTKEFPRSNRDTLILSSNRGCQKCLELFERLYQSGESEKNLLMENAALRLNLEKLETKISILMSKNTCL